MSGCRRIQNANDLPVLNGDSEKDIGIPRAHLIERIVGKHAAVFCQPPRDGLLEAVALAQEVLLERIVNLLRSDERAAGAVHGIRPEELSALQYLSRCNRYSDTDTGQAALM